MLPRRRAGLRRTLRRFAGESRGGVAIENAIAIVVLVGAFAGLLEIVSTVFESDRMGRAARAAARAVALDPGNDWCAAIRRELHLAEDFDCDTAWTVTVDHGVGPAALPATRYATAATGTGELVLVRIQRTRGLWSFLPDPVPVVNAAPDGGDGAGADPAPRLMTLAAIGLARREPDAS